MCCYCQDSEKCMLYELIVVILSFSQVRNSDMLDYAQTYAHVFVVYNVLVLVKQPWKIWLNYHKSETKHNEMICMFNDTYHIVRFY